MVDNFEHDEYGNEGHDKEMICFNKGLVGVVLLAILIGGVFFTVGKLNQQNLSYKSEASVRKNKINEPTEKPFSSFSSLYYLKSYQETTHVKLVGTINRGDTSKLNENQKSCSNRGKCYWSIPTKDGKETKTFCVDVGSCAGNSGLWCQKSGQIVSKPPTSISSYTCRNMDVDQLEKIIMNGMGGNEACRNNKGNFSKIIGGEKLFTAYNTDGYVNYVEAQVYTGYTRQGFPVGQTPVVISSACQVTYVNCCLKEGEHLSSNNNMNSGTKCSICPNSQCQKLKGKQKTEVKEVEMLKKMVDSGVEVPGTTKARYCEVYTGSPALVGGGCETEISSSCTTGSTSAKDKDGTAERTTPLPQRTVSQVPGRQATSTPQQ